MPNALVGVIMGSDSDLAVMRPAVDVLAEFGVAFEVRVVSAHRTPDVLYEYASTAADRGLHVIIAGAGGAAHLPGMTASMTPLPVIGVPVPRENLDGLDSLLSIRGAEVLRLKGLVRLEGEERPIVLQGVHHVLHPPLRLERWPEDRPRTEIVLITRGLSEAGIGESFAAALAAPAQPPR